MDKAIGSTEVTVTTQLQIHPEAACCAASITDPKSALPPLGSDPACEQHHDPDQSWGMD